MHTPFAPTVSLKQPRRVGASSISQATDTDSGWLRPHIYWKGNVFPPRLSQNVGAALTRADLQHINAALKRAEAWLRMCGAAYIMFAITQSTSSCMCAIGDHLNLTWILGGGE